MASISGGDRLAAELGRISQGLARGASVEIGFLEGATYPDGKSVPMIAAIMEYGAPRRNIPPRPFFRRMIAAKSGQWPKAISDLLKANDYDAARTLAQAGEAIKGQLQQSIIDLTSPPLSPRTIARKGFDKPLIETGHMLRTVDYRVKT